jgi:hypothetical protein
VPARLSCRDADPVSVAGDGPWPTAARFDDDGWAPGDPRNAELSSAATFLARGKIRNAETVFLKNSSDCDAAAYATDVRPVRSPFYLFCDVDKFCRTLRSILRF